MKGIVEVYSIIEDNEILLSRENNLIVDRGAEVFADIMTMNPKLADIPTASAILDTSNYTIRSISFGKDSYAFSSNAHSYTASTVLIGRGNGEVWVNIPQVSGSASSYNFVPSTTSFHQFVDNLLPPFPTPLDTKLENIISLDSNVSSFFQFGQNPNLIQFAGTCSLNFNSSLQVGCYPPASGINIQLRSSTGGFIASTTYSSILNLSGTMDYRGYVVLSSLRGAGTFSKETNSAFSSQGRVSYLCVVPAHDVGFANLYGGCYLFGLWTIDINEALRQGYRPPFTWSPTSNFPLRLFSKKMYTKNIFGTQDKSVILAGITNYADLNIYWTLEFI